MRGILLLLLFCGSMCAQNLSFFIHDPTGATPDTLLPSSISFPDTAVSASSSMVIRVINPTSVVTELSIVFVSNGATSVVMNPNFTVTGLDNEKIIPVQSAGFEDFTLSLAPITTGPTTGYLQAAYIPFQNGCTVQGAQNPTVCPPTVEDIATLTGNGLPSLISLTYTTTAGTFTPQSDSPTPLDFGQVSTSATQSIMFTLANQSAQTLNTPAVSVQSEIFGSSAFSLNTSQLPATLTPGQSANFAVTFAPGQTGLTSATLVVGRSTYAIQGTGTALTDIDALEIAYVNAAGVRTLPQAATPINFGSTTAGTAASTTLAFTVTNPNTSFSPVSLPGLTLTGAGFALANAPSMPASINPGSAITFNVVFSGGQAGTYTGTLSIGDRQFALTAQSASLSLPAVSIHVDASPLTSQTQAHVSVQLAAPSQITAIGTLTLQFTPSVANVTDDPAIQFVSTGSRQLNVSIAPNAQTATYGGSSSFTFQTGATAGTITFTLTFPDLAPITQSFTIAPQTVQIVSATTQWEEPNLVVIINGYDNTYSIGDLTFNFFDTSGKPIIAGGMIVNEANAFHNYFFTNNQGGGVFALQASFPVANGDVSQIGSVTVNLANSAGSATTTQMNQ